MTYRCWREDQNSVKGTTMEKPQEKPEPERRVTLKHKLSTIEKAEHAIPELPDCAQPTQTACIAYIVDRWYAGYGRQVAGKDGEKCT